ncbi:hypothetical protein GmHk_10G029447 [Glycine max]|nr:hypothetical protein GmHk_10G029447 [Glycine max]
MKSSHATVTVDEMLETLQRTTPDKEEEDEAMINHLSFIIQNVMSKEFVKKDIETEEQLNGHGETSNSSPSKPTDTFTKATLDDSSKQENS